MASGAETIKPYHGDDRHKGQQVREMFDNIAPAYDFMNRAMTLGIDKRWRARAVKMIKAHVAAQGIASPRILDIASGTGDLAILLARKLPQASVTGIDLSPGMTEIGMRKVAQAGLDGRISLQVGDCLALPFAQGEFDVVTVAYGVRNFERLAQGYSEMHRVLKPGGMLCVIELSTPTSPIVRPFYRLYTKHIIPVAGRLMSRDVRAYSYLPESIAAVPQGQEMLDIITAQGFKSAACLPLTFGVCSIYTALK